MDEESKEVLPLDFESDDDEDSHRSTLLPFSNEQRSFLFGELCRHFPKNIAAIMYMYLRDAVVFLSREGHYFECHAGDLQLSKLLHDRITEGVGDVEVKLEQSSHTVGKLMDYLAHYRGKATAPEIEKPLKAQTGYTGEWEENFVDTLASQPTARALISLLPVPSLHGGATTHVSDSSNCSGGPPPVLRRQSSGQKLLKLSRAMSDDVDVGAARSHLHGNHECSEATAMDQAKQTEGADAQEVLFELILIANYLDIQQLLDLLCAKVASMIKDKNPEQIRQTFNIQNDFTPEEEETVRAENRWAEDD